jgi:protein gp37
MAEHYNRGLGELILDEKCLKDNLGEGNTVFVGSSTDMWADKVPDAWIYKVIYRCFEHPKNTYLFQTKNPARFVRHASIIPKTGCILGTTIETNREDIIRSTAPDIRRRVLAMQSMEGWRKMVSIEPIMDFDVEEMIEMIKKIKPEFVSIGADSFHNKLIEPSAEKISKLKEGLALLSGIKVKSNLQRVMK